MKHLLTITLLFIGVIAFSQDPIKVEERRESFTTGMKNSLVVNIPIGTEDLVEKVLKDDLKKWKGKFTSKKEYVIEQATKSVITDKPIDVYVKIIKIAGGKIEVAFAVDLGGAYLNKAEHADMYRKGETKLYEIAKRISTEAVDLEVKEEEKKLKDLEKELSDLVKDKEKLEKSIESNKKKISDSKTKQSENKAAQAATKTHIEELYKTEPVDADKLKELNKTQEKNLKDADKLIKDISKAEGDIETAKNDIVTNGKSQEAKQKEIDAQKTYIEEEVKAKYAMIK
jgi:peptidoglycan hydrolase CwlO-like protein